LRRQGSKTYILTMEKISPRWAIVFSVIGTLVFITCTVFLYDQPNDRDVILLTGIGMVLAAIPWIIAAAMLHYRCWKAIPADIARTSPGAAVGLLFVPFFNFYWVFVSYTGLAEDCAKALDTKTSARGLGITFGILTIVWCMCIFALVPLVSIPIGIACFIIWLLFTRKVVACANELISKQP
jgi:hypothetical protein